MAKKDTELQKFGNSENSLAISTGEVPAWMRDDLEANTAMGTELIGSDEMLIPRLTLAQAGSPQTKEEDKNYIEGLRQGHFFNNLTKEIYGKGPLFFTPLFFKKTRRLFGSREEGSPTLCFTDNGETGGRINPPSCAMCPNSSFRYENGKTIKPACTLFYNYMIVLHLGDGKLSPIVWSLKSTGLNEGKKLNAFMRARRKAAFTGVYKVSSVSDVKAGVQYYTVNIDNAGLLSDQAIYNEAKELYNMMKDKIEANAVNFGDDAQPEVEAEVMDM